jgi:hypothetical protein
MIPVEALLAGESKRKRTLRGRISKELAVPGTFSSILTLDIKILPFCPRHRKQNHNNPTKGEGEA